MKYIKWKIVLVFNLLIFLVACKSIFDNDIVEYHYKSELTNVSGSLILKKNTKTFEYIHNAGLASQTSIGGWKKVGDKLMLNSASNYKTGFIEVEQSNTFSSYSKVRITLLEKVSKIPIPSATIFVNTNFVVTNEEGIALVDKKDLLDLRIKYIGETYVWENPQKLKGDIKIFLVEEDLAKAYFENEIWEYSDKNIISPNGLVYRKIN